MKKIFRVYKAFDRERSHSYGLRTSHGQFGEQAVSIERKTPKIKCYHKKSTLLVRKSRQLK